MTDQSPITFDSLREYIKALDNRGDVKRIDGANWDLEIGGLTETVAFSDVPKTLLFDDIEEYPSGYRVVTNLYNTESRQALGLGLPVGATGVELVNNWRDKVDKMDPIPPATVSTGPVQENMLTGDDVDILQFPIPKWREYDGGRFFGTGDVTITREYDGDWVNAAPYRAQVHDATTLGILVVPIHHARLHFREFWDRSEAAPVIMTAGQNPHVYASACIPRPAGESELNYAGGIKGEPIEVIEHEETGLPVPANAEIAVIGHVPPPEEETRIEGPFGECAGYYAGGEEERPVINVNEIWHRDDPILQGNPTMYGSAMRHALGGEIVTSARTWESLEADVPNVRGVYSVYQPCQQGSSVLAVSIEQEYAGHAVQAGVEALGTQAASNMNRAVIVVDEDINPADWEEVLLAVATRCDPGQDVNIVNGIPSSGLDARISPERKQKGDLTTSSMVIDACKPYQWREDFPRRNRINDEFRQQMVEKWDIDDWE